MSNAVSGSMQSAAQQKMAADARGDLRRREAMARPGAAQTQFRAGTMNMLDEARGVVENAIGQGQDLNPMIYQMLGLQPQYEDHSADLQAAQGEMDKAQQQYDQAQKTISQIKAVPAGRRSPQQRKQLNMLRAQMKGMTQSLQTAKDQFGRLQTMPKQITGLTRMDPSQIPANSPFSAQNPLYQAQQTEAQRLNQYLAGGDVDPTLKHQYSVAEDQLRASLAQRFGPDYESSSVGQMALSNFNRQKNEAFATWNQQQVEKYNNLAFQGQANLNALLGQNISLMREPSNTAIGYGADLSNQAGQRLNEEQVQNQLLLGRAGLTMSPVQPAASIGAAAAGGAGNALRWAVSEPTPGAGSPAGNLYHWATGTGAYSGSGMEGGQIAAPGGTAADTVGTAAEGAGAAEGGMTATEGASAFGW